MKTKNILKAFLKTNNKYEQEGLKIYFLLVENFSETYFVGGMVRDLLLGNKVTDIDIATKGIPDKVISLLKKHGYRLNTNAQRFGVVSVEVDSKQIEITSFRKEIYDGSRYPKIILSNSLTVDSKRRDFSINSLYFNAKLINILDPQKGLKDLKSKTLRLIGDPFTKLKEDPLRIVRAYRFAEQLNFSLDNETRKTLEKNFGLVKELTQTKLISEIKKSSSRNVKTFLQKKFHKYLHKNL